MTANGFSSYELFVKIITFYCILQYFLPLFMKTYFFILPNLKIVCRGLCVPTSETSCSSYFMKTDRQKTNFIFPLSTNTRPEKSRTPPDRSATPYYVESFRFQPGFIERKFKILKVLSKTLTWSQFSRLTAANMNDALLMLWKPTTLKHVEIKKARGEIPYNKICLAAPHHFSRPLLLKKTWDFLKEISGYPKEFLKKSSSYWKYSPG